MQEYALICADQWNTTYNGRWNLEFEWFIARLYYLGFQNPSYDYFTHQISIGKRSEIMVNKLFSTTRSVANYLTRNRPRIEVLPANIMEDGGDYLKDTTKNNKLLDYYQLTNDFRRKTRCVIKDGLQTSVGVLMTVWNSNAMDNKGDINYIVIDPFDFYIDPMATSISDARFCIYATAVTLEGLKKSGKYNKETLEQAEAAYTAQRSENMQKETLMFFKNGVNVGGSKNTGNILLREHWFYTDVPSGEKPKVVCVTTIFGKVIDEQIYEDMDELPFSIFQTDENSQSIYGVSYLQNLIPIQREYNTLLSSLSEYNRLMNKATYVVETGEQVSITDDRHGRVVEVSDPTKFSPQAVPGLNSALATEIDLFNSFWEDIGGQSEASRGRVPTGITSGRGLEILQIGDANNLSNLVESLERFLTDVGQKTLKLCSYHYTECRHILCEDNASRKEFMKVIGMGQATSTQKEEGVIEIPDKNMVRVYIGSYLTETPSSKLERLERLLQAGVIAPEDYLVAAQMTDIDDILQRRRDERVENANMELEQEAAKAAIGAEPQQPQTTAGVMVATQVLQAILNGEQPQVPENVDSNFLDYLVNFMNSEDGQTLDPLQQQMVQRVISQTQAMVGG